MEGALNEVTRTGQQTNPSEESSLPKSFLDVSLFPGKEQKPIRSTIPERSTTPNQSSFNWQELLRFPEISFQDFKKLPEFVQKELITRNRIVNTDTYNRTMGELASRRFAGNEHFTTETSINGGEATFTLQMRRSPFGYLIAAGIEDLVEELTGLPISGAELSFAKEFYKERKVPYFNHKMWENLVEQHEGKLPFEIRGLKDGSVALPGETLLTVRGPVELIAHFEQNFHRAFYPVLVATRAHEILQIVEDPARFIEVGKRGAITEAQHLLALKAMQIGAGFELTSNDAGAGLFSLKDVGTIGHRYIQTFQSEEAAFRHAIDNLSAVTLLVDLVDTYKGIELALKLKAEYRDTNKKIWIRLDSGDILDQTRYFLNRTKELGMTDPLLDKIIVEGIDSLDEIAKIERMIICKFGPDARARVLYGAGGLLISEQTSRSDASSGFKIAQFSNDQGELEDTMKFSNSPGKISHPGSIRLVINQGKRLLAQKDETFEGKTTELFELLYDGINGTDITKSTLSEAQIRRQQQFAVLDQASIKQSLPFADLKATPSPDTLARIRKVKDRYGVQ